MPRAPTGSVVYVPARAGETYGHWKARVTLLDGKRPWLHLEPSPKSPQTEARARETARAKTEQWRKPGAVTPLARGTKAAPTDGETVEKWVERWIEDRERRGIASYKHDHARFKNHVLPVLGAITMTKVSKDDLERVVDSLDEKVRDEAHEQHVAWKTSLNVWTLCTSAFADACTSKNRSLRVRIDNPALGVRGPDRGDARAKTYLYPSELLQLLGCEDVPLHDRRLYALLVYTFLRAGELQALQWSDVDLEHGVVSITKAIDRDDDSVKSTKTGETRRIPIEPNLRPLLEVLHRERTGTDVIRMPPHNERALRLRAHLLKAGVKREALHTDNARQKRLTLHDLRSTGITHAAVRGDDPLRIKQRAGHRGFATTEGYIREAENLVEGFGDPLPKLPENVVGSAAHTLAESSRIVPETAKSSKQRRREGDSNPWYPRGHT